MLNQLNTIDDLMTRLEFHADQSAKRRKLLFVDPFEVDDTNDGIEKLIIFRVRKSVARPLYEYSTWGRMLMNPRTQDPTDKKGGVLFRLWSDRLYRAYGPYRTLSRSIRSYRLLYIYISSAAAS